MADKSAFAKAMADKSAELGSTTNRLSEGGEAYNGGMVCVPLLLFLASGLGRQGAPLPVGVRAAWDLSSAWKETTPTRERVCLNGLWRWRPGGEALPTSGWGWFKVPGPWPGISDYMQKDCQTVIKDPSWEKENLGLVTTAWYQRTFTVPAGWMYRRIGLHAGYVNSLASVFIDGKPLGTISFPAGEVDLTNKLLPGSTHKLSIQVVALPLKAVMLSYSDTNAAKQMKATVERRGLCGDVFLVSTPMHARIENVRIAPSVRTKTITVVAATKGLDPSKKYWLKAKIFDHGSVVETLTSGPFQGKERVGITKPWVPRKLWDLNTPQNQYDLQLSLLDEKRNPLDIQTPKRFGFRELWIDKRDFILNGTRVFWSCVPIDNAAISAGLASYEGAKESFRRLKQIGINMVYTHNYDCKPGSNLAFDEILRAADDVGVLVALTQPHFGDYDWSAPDADKSNGYARHAAFFAEVAGTHPSVVAYSTSHNATGYNEDTNPDMIDGIHGDRDSWAQNNMKKALRAQAIIEGLDPTRIVYHHSSGNLGTMHTMNFYLNFVPIQEMDDWYEHWATVGVKPAFMVEYGVPFSWDWSLYRGWYKGQRSFGSAQAPWEYTMAEWNAQFLGDRAYNVSEAEKRNVRWEANKFKTSEGWFRWDYPTPMGASNPEFEDQQEVWAKYTTDNWRAFRTWGVSGISPWETSGTFWRLKDGVNRNRIELKTDWDHLQRPGYSPDYIDGRYEKREDAYDQSDWITTTGGKSLLANNSGFLAYIGGKPEAFTDKEHNFRPGDTVEKQIVLVNNTRQTIKGLAIWSLDLPTKVSSNIKFSIETGDIQKIPLKFKLPASLRPGRYVLRALVPFNNPIRAEFQDEFSINVLPPTPIVSSLGQIGIFDPKGETKKLLEAKGIAAKLIAPNSDLSGIDTLVVGKAALTLDGPGLNLCRVREGLKVIVFEQTSEVLEQRFGFRVQEYGLRNVFRRIPDHPVLAGLDEETLRDWHGRSTLLPERRPLLLTDKYYGAPTAMVNGLLVPRVWRCGNRGDVASVLIEKPAAGDFSPILDGGFSLQYSPLLEFREGKGMVVFCQVDVTGRTESDPAADRLVSNLLRYVSTWKPKSERTIVYAGEQAGKRHLQAAGYPVEDYSSGFLDGKVLVVGPGVDTKIGNQLERMAIEGHALVIGLDGDTIQKTVTLRTETKTAEYIDSTFPPAPAESVFAGIGPADVYNRDPRLIPVLSHGGGVLAANDDGRLVQFQLTPWSFDTSKLNAKRVFRHTSVVLARLLGNMGVHGATPLLARFNAPLKQGEKRWLKGLYLDNPVEDDDPYRFFGW